MARPTPPPIAHHRPLAATVAGGVGRALIGVGLVVLLFVAYQLWGTGLQEARAQRLLAHQLDEQLAATTAPTAVGASATAGAPALVAAPAAPVDVPVPAEGDPIAKIEIPSIGITRTVVSGATVTQLKRGPAHYRSTPLPGQPGNVVIAGHRTTYGQPFHNIDKIDIGDQIIFVTAQGTFVYVVSGHEIVSDTHTEVLDDAGDNRVTLIACHPKWSAKQRYIVVGKLVGRTVPMRTGQAEVQRQALARHEGDPLADRDEVAADRGSTAAAIAWGLVAALVVLVVERTRRRAGRLVGWTVGLLGLPVFALVLYLCFDQVSHLLPSTF